LLTVTENPLPSSGIAMNPKILIVDDHALLRKGLIALLKRHFPDGEIHEAGNGVQAIVKATEVKPDIILMDYYMPRLNGSKAASVIMKNLPETKVIMISMDESPEFISSAFHIGITGVISKDVPEEELLRAIRDAIKGRSCRDRKFRDSESVYPYGNIRKKPRDHRPVAQLLTERELEIVRLMVRGMSQKSMASMLSISKRTLDAHKEHIFKKLQVHSSVEVIRFAIRNKLVSF
jgi:DNA-binding NarL/FixJ family response regulator